MISKITSVLSFPLQISVIYPWWETPHTQNGQYTEEKRNILPTTGIWHTVFIFSPCMHSHFRRVWLFMTPWTVASQVPLSMGFSRQKYWSWLPCPPPGYLPDPGMEPGSLMSPSLAVGLFTTSTTWSLQRYHMIQQSHSWSCSQKKYNSQRLCTQCSLKHCSQYPEHGSSLSVHKQLNG